MRLARRSKVLEEDGIGVGMSTDTVAIPGWSPQGTLPPSISATPTTTNPSPYCVSLVDFVLRFGNTEPRQKIVIGFLNFRAALQATGLVNGFQWIDGSFLENIEMLDSRDPHDIDVVTFFHMPDGENQQTLLQTSPRLFNSEATKEDYLVDAYFVQLNTDIPELLVAQSTYWNSLWSHRRNGQWKGYLQVDLSSTRDQVAKANLDIIVNEEGQP